MKKTVGERICKILKERNITKDDAANLLNINKKDLMDWCSGQRYPAVYNLVDLSDLTGKPLGWFFGEEEKEPVQVRFPILEEYVVPAEEKKPEEDQKPAVSEEDLRTMRDMHNSDVFSDSLYIDFLEETLLGESH